MEAWKIYAENTPKAWKYFIDFYHSDFVKANQVENIDFNKLPFEMQLGVYIKFFDQINSDIQLYATDMDALKESVKEAFDTYEEYLFLDS